MSAEALYVLIQFFCVLGSGDLDGKANPCFSYQVCPFSQSPKMKTQEADLSLTCSEKPGPVNLQPETAALSSPT